MKNIVFYFLLFGCILFHNKTYAFRVFPTSAQNEKMFDKANFPFIAENADGFNLQYDSFGPFSNNQVQTIFEQFKNKNFINHGVFKGTDIMRMSTMTKMPSIANVTAFMLYNEAPAMNADEWNEALSQNVAWPLITHCRSYSKGPNHDEIRDQIQKTSGIMMEFKVTEPNKFDDAAELLKYCVDNDRMVVFLTTFQDTPEIFISAYKEFYYYLKENLAPSYLESDYVIFVPNTYSDENVFPETIGYGSTFGVAHWLIDQKSKVGDGYIQPKITFQTPVQKDYFQNHSNISAEVNVQGASNPSVKLYIDNTLVGNDTSAPYVWSGGALNNLTTGYKQLRAAVTDDKGITTEKVIQIKILKDPPNVPGFFWADNVLKYKLRNDPLPNGIVRHVYGGEWIDYKVNVMHTGTYDLDVDLFVQRSKQFGGTIILKKGSEELGRFTTILNDPAETPLPNFVEEQTAVIKNIKLTKGMQTLRVVFSHPKGYVKPQFYLNNFNFKIQGAPKIAFVTPIKNDADTYGAYNAPANIKIATSITSPRNNGLIKEAKLYVNNTLVKTLKNPPFIWNDKATEEGLSSLPQGEYVVKVEATDELGYTSFEEIKLKVIDRKPFNENLKIPGVINAYEFDLGKEGIGYHDFNEGLERGLGGAQNPRHSKAGSEDVEIEHSAGSYCVSAVRSGEWLNYTMSKVEKGTYTIKINTAANAGKSADVKVWLNDKVIATVPISETAQNGFRTFKNFTVENIIIPKDMEKATVKIEFLNPSIRNYLCFFRNFEFEKTSALPRNSNVTIDLVSPTQDLVVEEGYELTAQVNASSDIVDIQNVTLYINGDEKRYITSAPFKWGHEGSPHPQELSGLGVGEHIIKFVATDELDNKAEVSFVLRVDKATRLNLKNKKTKLFSVYPNPCKEKFSVILKEDEPAAVFVYDIFGKLVYQNEKVFQECLITDKTLSKTGTYFVYVKVKDRGTDIQKVMLY